MWFPANEPVGSKGVIFKITKKEINVEIGVFLCL